MISDKESIKGTATLRAERDDLLKAVTKYLDASFKWASSHDALEIDKLTGRPRFRRSRQLQNRDLAYRRLKETYEKLQLSK